MVEVNFSAFVNKWVRYKEVIVLTSIARGMLQHNVGGNLLVPCLVTLAHQHVGVPAAPGPEVQGRMERDGSRHPRVRGEDEHPHGVLHRGGRRVPDGEVPPLLDVRLPARQAPPRAQVRQRQGNKEVQHGQALQKALFMIDTEILKAMHLYFFYFNFKINYKIS